MVEHERIVARRAELGMSQAELARRVGISQPMIVEIEKGRVHSTKFVIELARALNLPPQEIDPRYAEHPPIQLVSLEPLGDLPVRRVVLRDGRTEFLAGAVDTFQRPAALTSVRDAYAVLMPDDTMSPEFEPGDVLLVHPHLPAVRGHSYVFRHAADDGAMIRRLVAAEADRWAARLWAAPAGEEGETWLSRFEWPELHRIIGKFSRG